jgi:hypothetical protein
MADDRILNFDRRRALGPETVLFFFFNSTLYFLLGADLWPVVGSLVRSSELSVMVDARFLGSCLLLWPRIKFTFASSASYICLSNTKLQSTMQRNVTSYREGEGRGRQRERERERLGSPGSHGDFPFTLSAPSSGDLKPPRGQVKLSKRFTYTHSLTVSTWLWDATSTRLSLSFLSFKWTTMKAIISSLIIYFKVF